MLTIKLFVYLLNHPLFMKKTTCLFCTLLLLCAVNQSWSASARPEAIRETLSRVPAAEFPAQAAELIKQVKGREQPAVTVQVVKTALELNPAAAPAVVGAICRAVPETAAVAAGTAAEQQPKQASLIARAAAAAAPAKVGKIVAAVCKAVPNDYQNIALAVAEVVPGAGKEILEAIASAIPGIKTIVSQVLLAEGGSVRSVAYALNQINVARQSKAGLPEASPISSAPSSGPAGGTIIAARGPAVGPPYIPLSGTPSNVNPTNTGTVPTGGRGYAAP